MHALCPHVADMQANGIDLLMMLLFKYHFFFFTNECFTYESIRLYNCCIVHGTRADNIDNVFDEEDLEMIILH